MQYSKREVEQVITKFCHQVAEFYGVKLEVKFKAQRRTFYRHQPHLPYRLIVFGWESLTYWMEKGFHEYRSLQYLVPRPAPVGMEAAWWLACHELGHLVQYLTPDGRTFGSSHNNVFIHSYQEVRELFPFESLGYGKQQRHQGGYPEAIPYTVQPSPQLNLQVAHATETLGDLPTRAKDRKTFRSKVRDYLKSKGLDYAIRDGVYYVASTHQVIYYDSPTQAIEVGGWEQA